MIKRLAFVLALAACGGEAPPPATPPPPVTKAAPDAGSEIAVPNRFGYPATTKSAVTDAIFGEKITDDYRWLEDGKAEEVKTWLKAQDDFTRRKLAALPERAKIGERLKELFYVESHGLPTKAGNRYFYSRRDARAEKSIVYVREGKAGKERALLDPHSWSKDGSVALGSWEESRDGKYVAYAQKQNNADEATLHVMDVTTGKPTSDVIEGAKYASPSWTPRGDGFYYTWVPTDKSIPTAERPGYQELRFHKLGVDPKTDKTVREKTGDPKTFHAVEMSRDGHFLFARVQHGWSATDVFFKDMRKGEPKDWRPLVAGKPFKYDVTAHKDRFYVRTDDGAPHGHLFKVDPDKPDRAEWKEIVPESASATLDSWNVVGDMLAISWLEDVKSKLEVRDLEGKLVREIKLPTLGTASVIVGNPEEDVGWFSFTSFTYPSEIYEISMKTGAQTLFHKLKVPVDPSKLEVEQYFAKSKDGTRVPYFLVRARDFKRDGTAPLLLYGYGGFLISQKPSFASYIYPWLERGGVFAIANLRGGGEYGEDWHKAGMRRNKQNVFDDLFAVTEKLIADKVSSPQKIAVRGASNGGLLVGAAIVQRPDLYRVGLCGVPLLDMVRYHQFGSGKTWIEEYGSSEDPEDFKAIYAYSPYHHVKAGAKYPSLLILSADSDDRVDPMHAWKFAAKMQASSTGGVVLLRIEKNSGHGGADLVSQRVEQNADELAFALSEIGQ